MIRQQIGKEKQSIGKLYDFIEFQKRKPFFHESLNITVGPPINETYIMVKNVVYKEKQILILRKRQDSRTIILVEAVLKDGQLQYISKLSDDFIQDISRMLEAYL